MAHVKGWDHGALPPDGDNRGGGGTPAVAQPGAGGQVPNASQYFGPQDVNNPYWAVGVGDNRLGAGYYGLPPAFSGWTGAARYSIPLSQEYANKLNPVIEHFQKNMGKDYSKELYGLSADAYEGAQRSAKSQQEQGLARAGYGGGGAVSPFAALQVQQEAQARAGAMGTAARQGVLQAQQMSDENARGLYNALGGWLQGLLVPSQLQAAQTSQSPTGQLTPSLWGPGLNAGAAAFGAFT